MAGCSASLAPAARDYRPSIPQAPLAVIPANNGMTIKGRAGDDSANDALEITGTPARVDALCSGAGQGKLPLSWGRIRDGDRTDADRGVAGPGAGRSRLGGSRHRICLRHLGGAYRAHRLGPL